MLVLGVVLLVVALSVAAYLAFALTTLLRDYDDIDWGDDEF